MYDRPYTLRPYQVENIESIRAAILQGYRSLLREQYPRTGKSVEIVEIAISAIERGNEVLICVPFPHLVENLERYFLKADITPGIVQGTRKVSKPHPLLTIACIPTLVKRLSSNTLKLNPTLILLDEYHRGKSSSWLKVTNAFPDVYRIAWTGTPKRGDGQGFEDVCDILIPGKSVKWYIENKYLSPYEYYESPIQLEEGDKTTIAGDLWEEWVKYAEGLPTIVFAPTIAQSKQIALEYNQMAMEKYGREIAVHLDGTMSKKYVNKIMWEHFGKEVQIVVNVDLFSEGIDLPDCWCVQMVAFSESITRVIQRWARCLTYVEGKVARILDHVGISAVHGYPCNDKGRDREWSLEGQVDPEKLILNCYFCGGLLAPDKRKVRATDLQCPHCGEVNHFERETRDYDTTRGNYNADPSAELVSVSQRRQTQAIQQIIKQRERQANAKFWAVYQAMLVPDLEVADFRQLCIKLGYSDKYPWELNRIYKILHTNSSIVSYDKGGLKKALGKVVGSFWSTYCKVQGIEE